MIDFTIALYVERTPVIAQTNYNNYEPILRWDFWFSCAYCTLTEIEANGVAYNIDHYIPTSTVPGGLLKTEYSNLMYTCYRCNRTKSDFPTDTWLNEGRILHLRPDQDNFHDHLKFSENGLEHISERGELHLALLGLDLDPMKTVYLKRNTIMEEQAKINTILKELNSNRILDELHPQHREHFLKTKSTFVEQIKAIRQLIDPDCKTFLEEKVDDLFDVQVARITNSSTLVSEFKSEDRKKEMSKRRKDLKRIGAVIP